MSPATGRLAPTPSGDLHLGNTVSFLACWLSVRRAGGRLLLRIEDVDQGRARTDVADRQRSDLAWLGLHWDAEVPAQSTRDYAPWAERLSEHTYRCTCTRRDVAAAGGVYPGTCRSAGHTEGKLRLRLPSGLRTVTDRRLGTHTVDPSQLGDPVLQRADGVYTYPLAVVADDITDGVTEVVRGADLLKMSAGQEVLWELLGATPPTWLHAPLIVEPSGRKLGKSYGSLNLAGLRQAGWTPEDVLRLVLPWLGLPHIVPLQEAAALFEPTAGERGPIVLHLPEHGGCPSPEEGLRWTPESGDSR